MKKYVVLSNFISYNAILFTCRIEKEKIEEFRHINIFQKN